MKALRNVFSGITKSNTCSSQASLSKASSKHNLKNYTIPSSPLRNECIEWLYRAQLQLKFSRSSLFIAFGLLDKLLRRGLALTQGNFQLVSGSLVLIATKFNEVYPVKTQKLNCLCKGQYSLKQYVEAEGAILHNVDFTVILEPVYEQLVELESRYKGAQREEIEGMVKMAILNPVETFKFGSASLVEAVESLKLEGELFERSSNSSNKDNEIQSIRKQLSRLHSTSHNRLVSPTRF